MHLAFGDRLLIVFLLFCKLVTAQMAFAPAAMAMQPANAKIGSGHPCPQHKEQPSSHEEHSQHDGACKSASCKCPCAHTPAFATLALQGLRPVDRQAAPALYTALSPRASHQTVFRPPIRSAA